MGRVLRSNQATEDLVDIFTEAALRSTSLVERRAHCFRRDYRAPLDNPGLGSRRLPSRPEIRVFPCDRYLIFYRELAARAGVSRSRPARRPRPATRASRPSLDVGRGFGPVEHVALLRIVPEQRRLPPAFLGEAGVAGIGHPELDRTQSRPPQRLAVLPHTVGTGNGHRDLASIVTSNTAVPRAAAKGTLKGAAPQKRPSTPRAA